MYTTTVIAQVKRMSIIVAATITMTMTKGDITVVITMMRKVVSITAAADTITNLIFKGA